MDPLTGILKNWSFLGSAQVISSLIAMVFTVVVSRALGDVEFGRLYLALTLTSLVGVVVDFGLAQVVTRAVARDRRLARPYFKRATIIVAAIGTCFYLLLLASVKALGFTAEVFSLVVILGLFMIVDAFSQVLGALFLAHERMLTPALSRVAGNAIALVLVLPVLLRSYGTAMVATVIVIAAILRVAIQAFALRGLSGLRLPAPEAPSWRALLRAGLPFVAAQGLGLFVFKIDVIVLGRMASEATVGWYAAASRVVDSFNFVPILLTMATFPVLSRLWVDAPNDFRTTFRKTLDVLIAVTLPATVMLFALAPDLIGSLFTLDSYGPAVPILRIQAISLALVFVDYLLACTLMATGRERTWIAILAVACILNPVLNWLLIPPAQSAYANGAIGAALATLLTEVFILTFALRAVPSATFAPGSLWAGARASALAAALGVFLFTSRSLGMPWIAAAVAGGIGYAAAAIWLGVLPQNLMAWARRATATPDVRTRGAGGEQTGDVKAADSPSGVEAA